ncbi:uncharacterized [Lates japonicus]
MTRSLVISSHFQCSSDTGEYTRVCVCVLLPNSLQLDHFYLFHPSIFTCSLSISSLNLFVLPSPLSSLPSILLLFLFSLSLLSPSSFLWFLSSSSSYKASLPSIISSLSFLYPPQHLHSSSSSLFFFLLHSPFHPSLHLHLYPVTSPFLPLSLSFLHPFFLQHLLPPPSFSFSIPPSFMSLILSSLSLRIPPPLCFFLPSLLRHPTYFSFILSSIPSFLLPLFLLFLPPLPVRPLFPPSFLLFLFFLNPSMFLQPSHSLPFFLLCSYPSVFSYIVLFICPSIFLSWISFLSSSPHLTLYPELTESWTSKTHRCP